MRARVLTCLTALVLGAGCRDATEPGRPLPVSVTTDRAEYTRPSSWSSMSVEVGVRNNTSSTIWIKSCGEAYSSLPGTSPLIAVYGLQLVSYETNPPRVGDVAGPCDGGPVPYALAPGMGVRLGVVLTELGRFAFSVPFSEDASGTNVQRTGSPDFTIVAGP
jgi:hypothetical protein